MIRNSFSVPRLLATVPMDVVALLRRIDLAQGAIDRLTRDAPAMADSLAERSRIESVIASNELEGVRTERARAERLVRSELAPITRDDHEIAGYRAAVDDVITHPRQAVTVARLLHWHRELFRYAGPDVAGRFKRSENRVTNPDGTDRFRTVPARYAESAVVDLTEQAEAALVAGVMHPVVITAAFTLDLLVIHPFEDGNGRTARIASNAMLARGEYSVGRYISIEQLLGDRRTMYYESLRNSTRGWHTSTHTIWPWTEFLAEVLVEAYDSLERRIGSTTPQAHRELVTHWLATSAPGTFSMSEARSELAGVPLGAIRAVLKHARDAGAVQLRGTGRAARWVLIDRSRLRAESDRWASTEERLVQAHTNTGP